MSENIIGLQTIAQTLGVSVPLVTISGTIDAAGSSGSYLMAGNEWAMHAAVFAPEAGMFTIINDGFVDAPPVTVSPGQGAFEYGIVLGGTSEITNAGRILGAGGIAVAGSNASLIDNAGQITGTSYYGIGIFNGPGTVLNAGTVAGHVAGIELFAGGLVSNASSGVLLSAYGPGVSGAGQAMIENAGTIAGANGVDLLSTQGVVENSGLIEAVKIGALAAAYAGIAGYQGGTILNAGTISGADGIVLLGGNGTVITSGLIESSGSYAVKFASGFDNVLEIEAGARFAGAVDGGDVVGGAGSSVLELGAGGGTLSLLDAHLSGFQTISFLPGDRWVLEADAAALSGGERITGLTLGDTIEIDGFSASTQSYVSGIGLELVSGSSIMTLDIAGGLNGAVVLTAPAPAACFCRGTRIHTPQGKRPVEALRIGELVDTAYNGAQRIRWIGHRRYEGAAIAGQHLTLPVRIRRHALGFNVPSRDLHVSPGHAIFEDGVLVHAWRLINGVSITQAARVSAVEYFHIELENHTVIFAENTPVESFFDNGCRGEFQNAETAPETAMQRSFLPQIEDGYYLARVKARIDARAGLPRHGEIGPLRGFLDHAGGVLRGWAQDVTAPECPVELELVLGGQVAGRFLANKYRPDLRAAGIGSGCHAFELPLPAQAGALSIRRTADGAVFATARA